MHFDGIASPLSQRALEFTAATLHADPPAIWAVLSVETSGTGFLPDRRVKILFERHVFHRQTGGRFDAQAPDLSQATAGGYGAPGPWQHERLARAMKLDPQAALRSASWGLGQVMGFNAQFVGYGSAAEMVEAFRDSEDQQLGAMMAYVRNAHLGAALGAHEWAAFAHGYNGASFQKNGYDTKLAQFHARYRVGPMPNLLVRWTQMALTFLRVPGVGSVDGWYGDLTQQALLRFQGDAGIPLTGVPDAQTVQQLANGLGWTSPL
ncbi:MAG TPA: N-acetylmuramidase domain-containing protein [Ramlibacter sp.]|nr:N-acetylmuramidase domain-containing protein [Ramlibacter sp.]